VVEVGVSDLVLHALCEGVCRLFTLEDVDVVKKNFDPDGLTLILVYLKGAAILVGDEFLEAS